MRAVAAPIACGPGASFRRRSDTASMRCGAICSDAGDPEIARKANLPEEMVRDIVRKVDRNEYKRQQAAPGLRITAKAFGMGRRFPIAHRFTE